MKKFQFSLDKMLSYEEQMLEKEKNSLMQLNYRRAEIENKIEMLIRDRQRRYDDYKAASDKPMSAIEIQSYGFFCDTINKQIKQLKKELIIANTACESQRTIVIKASQNVEKLTRLEDKQKEEYDYAVTKKEEDVIAEFVSSSFIRSRTQQD